MNKRSIVILLALLGWVGFLPAQDARDIVEKSRNRIDAKTVSARTRMVLTDKKGSTSEQMMDQYEKKDAAGNHRTVIVFQRPASIKNTRFLTIETTGKGDDQRIFLPKLGKVRRISASEGSGSFMGTDLSYDDISSSNRDVNLDTHKLLREDSFQGNPCFVIESVPLDKNYQYSKMVQWIGKDTYLPWKVELYNAKGRMIKVLETLETAEKQGYFSPMRRKMSTLDEGTSTEIITDILKYDDPVPESVFTDNFLKTGKP